MILLKLIATRPLLANKGLRNDRFSGLFFSKTNWFEKPVIGNYDCLKYIVEFAFEANVSKHDLYKE